ncbi:cytochrome P450 [Gorgonomyces haynaldii]|nr:cytochrome P450 [Gorgonomyces haynaldii]
MIIFLALAVVVLWYWNDALLTPVRMPKSVQRSSKIPVLKNLFDILNCWKQLHLLLLKFFVKYEWRTYLFQLPLTEPWLVTADPKNVEHILKTQFDNYYKGPQFQDKMHDLLGHGIFGVDGEEWRSIRKTASNIFNIKGFRYFVEDVFVQEYVAFRDRLKIKAREHPVFDLQDMLLRFTLQTFVHIAYGTDLKVVQSEKPVPFAASFDRLLDKTLVRFYNPLWKITERWQYPEKQHDLTYLKDFAVGLVKDRKLMTLDERNGQQDLLSHFMNARDWKGDKYSDERLAEHVMNFVFAGRDTTAQMLSWTMLDLSKNPRVLEKLRQEVKHVCGDGFPTYDHIKDMKYANAVFHESIRLHPAVPGNMAQAIHDDTLPDGTPVPAGAQVLYSAYCMARNPNIWGPDCEEYKPERWLDRTVSAFEYPAFKAGPRICLGKNFAELEGVFVLSCMVRDFEIEVVRKDVTYKPAFTHPIDGGLQVRMSERSQ